MNARNSSDFRKSLTEQAKILLYCIQCQAGAQEGFDKQSHRLSSEDMQRLQYAFSGVLQTIAQSRVERRNSQFRLVVSDDDVRVELI